MEKIICDSFTIKRSNGEIIDGVDCEIRIDETGWKVLTKTKMPLAALGKCKFECECYTGEIYPQHEYVMLGSGELKKKKSKSKKHE